MNVFTDIDVDFSGVVAKIAAMSEEEREAAYQAVENPPKWDWRRFVADVRAHPEHLTSWDSEESFEDFAKRVDAGEFD